MVFDSTAYLAGKFSELHNIKFYEAQQNEAFQMMLTILGNFRVEPGEIKIVKEKDCFGKKAACDSLVFSPFFDESTFICKSFSIDANGGISIDGSKSNTVIKMDNYSWGTIKMLVTSGENAGYYIIKSARELIYYNMVAIKCLKEKYNITGNELMNMDDNDLLTYGFRPDNVVDSDLYVREFDYGTRTTITYLMRYLIHDYDSEKSNGFLRNFDLGEEKEKRKK